MSILNSNSSPRTVSDASAPPRPKSRIRKRAVGDTLVAFGTSFTIDVCTLKFKYNGLNEYFYFSILFFKKEDT